MMLALAASFYFTLSTCSLTANGNEFDESSFLQVHSTFNKSGVNLVRSPQNKVGPQGAITRPGYESNVTDTVRFGILLKNWYSIDLAKEIWDVDVVVTLRWSDPRVAQLLPEGHPGLMLSDRRAQKAKVWLPDIVVTNADEGENNIISSSVLIKRSGAVEKVMRLYLQVKEKYRTKDFPFDTQDLVILLGSRVYMITELKLEPIMDPSLWGAAPEKFNNSIWSLVNASLTSFDDRDGALDKSRGRFSVVVKRGSSEFRSSIFIPSIIFLIMTWSALWLPMGTPYIMPRVSINTFALLCQVSISQTVDHMLPASGETSWMTLYLELCVELQFLVMLINMILVFIEHRAGEGHTLAERLNSELTWTFPITTTINLVILWQSLYSLSRTLIVVVYLGYMAYLSARFYFKKDFLGEAKPP